LIDKITTLVSFWVVVKFVCTTSAIDGPTIVITVAISASVSGALKPVIESFDGIVI